MMRTLLNLLRLGVVIGGGTLIVATTAARAQDGGRLAAQLCSACHGAHGNSQSPMFPRLNGQTHDYLVAQLKGFREHVRGESDARSYMWAIASQLDDTTVASLADYFSTQTPTAPSESDPVLAAQGKTLFENGDPQKGVPACASCHGERGQGNGQFPRIAGQHGDYLLRQIDVFRNGTRANSPVMAAVAHTLDKEQANAVVAYLRSR